MSDEQRPDLPAPVRDTAALDLLRELVAVVGACSCPCDCDYDDVLDRADVLLAGQPAAPGRALNAKKRRTPGPSSGETGS